ncbi:MAG: ATP-binding protein [Alphaproteobacteria bacterium]|nr:ATP-binding protein [Alphaproteobacteria bacterium]
MAVWTLWAAVALSVVAAYILLSSLAGLSPQLSPQPSVLTEMLARAGIGQRVWGQGGLLALALAFLFVFLALGAHSARARNELLIDALIAEPHGRAISDIADRLFWRNPAFGEIVGDIPGEGLASFSDIIADDDGKAQFSQLKKTAFAGGDSSAELRVNTGEGVHKWLKIQATPLSGRAGLVLWCVEDITLTREMAEEVAQERVKLLDFLENPEIGFYSVDGEGRFEFANAAFGQWLGVPARTLVREGRYLADVVGGQGIDPERPFSPFPPGRGSDQAEATFRCVGGDDFKAEVIQTIAGDLEAGTLTARAMVRDLTAEKEFEVILAASEHRFRKLFEEAPVGIAILDRDGTVTDSNLSFRRIAAEGRDPAGNSVTELVAFADRPRLERRLGDAAEGAVSDTVLDVSLAEPADGNAALYVTSLEDAQGGLSGLILHLFDTTQLRRLEAQFTQSQKLQAVGQLAGGIAHDFNNLLTVMIGFCDLVLERHRPGEQTFADIMQIKQNANRATNLVRQLLAFSRQQTLQPKILDLTDVLAELSNLLRRLIGVNITLDVVYGRDIGLVRVDQVQLEQVIINLAVNARDAMADGGTLTIATTNADIDMPIRRGTDVIPPGRYVCISVTDTGTGISKEIMERIFDPFFTTKEVGAGTGLGLSTVYGIVRQTGGFVQVESEGGKGTEFSIYLPYYEQSEQEMEEMAASRAAAEAPRPAKDLSGVGTVLLVEDEDAVRLFGARALRNKGYKVLEAKNGKTALEVLGDADDPIDLVISDVVMPELDGPALVNAVREQYPDMKVIFISGYAEDQFRESIERQSDIHFLPKPFSLEQLAGKVKDVLDG